MKYQSRVRIPNHLLHREDIENRVFYELITNLVREIPKETLNKIFNVTIIPGTEKALKETTDPYTQDRIHHLIYDNCTEYTAEINIP